MRRDDVRHGTYAGYQEHRREGVRPCKPCREAANAYHRMWVAKNREQVKAENNARVRALWKLAKLHRDEFQVLCAEEMPRSEAS